MDDERVKKIKKVLNGDIYEDLRRFLLEQVNDLSNIDNVRELSKAQDQAIELKAQKKAYYKVQAILNTIVAIKDMPEPEEVDNKNNDYGVE